MKALRKIADKVLDIITLLAGYVLASAVILYTINCFMRYCLKAPMAWPEEYCTYFVVFMVYLLQCRLEFKGEELTIGLIDNQLKKSKALRRIIFYVQALITIGIYGYLYYVGMEVVKKQYQYATVTPIMKIPYGVYFNLINICLVIVIVFWIVNLLTKDLDEVPAEEAFD